MFRMYGGKGQIAAEEKYPEQEERRKFECKMPEGGIIRRVAQEIAVNEKDEKLCGHCTFLRIDAFDSFECELPRGFPDELAKNKNGIPVRSYECKQREAEFRKGG